VTGQGDHAITYTAEAIAKELGMDKPERFSLPDPQPDTQTIAQQMGLDRVKSREDGYTDLLLEATRRSQGHLELAYLRRFLISMRESDVPFYNAHSVMRMVYDYGLHNSAKVRPSADEIFG
jgi:hypothetical protein